MHPSSLMVGFHAYDVAMSVRFRQGALKGFWWYDDTRVIIENAKKPPISLPRLEAFLRSELRRCREHSQIEE